MASCRLRIRITPRGGADRIDGVETDADGRPQVRLRVRALPEDGEANAAVIRLMAAALGVSRSALRITSGETSRFKTIEIDGLDETASLTRLLA